MDRESAAAEACITNRPSTVHQGGGAVGPLQTGSGRTEGMRRTTVLRRFHELTKRLQAGHTRTPPQAGGASSTHRSLCSGLLTSLEQRNDRQDCACHGRSDRSPGSPTDDRSCDRSFGRASSSEKSN